MQQEKPQHLSLHDAELIAVSFDRVRAVARLDFCLEDGTHCLAELQGLRAFRGEDLTLQNVISRLRQSSRKEVFTDELDHWITWATSSSDADSWLTDERRREWCELCANGTLELVVFEPSAGAHVVCVCERVVVTRLQKATATPPVRP